MNVFNPIVRAINRALKRAWRKKDLKNGGVHQRIAQLEHELQKIQKFLQSNVEISVDVSANRHDPHRIILISQYRGKDYVQMYSFTNRDNQIGRLIDHIRELSKIGYLERIDEPRGWNLRSRL